MMNQCDGCRVNAPLTGLGHHKMPDGGYMGCTREQYEGLMMIYAPEKIYLNVGDMTDYDLEQVNSFEELTDVTWCSDKIDDNDIAYIRADLVPQWQGLTDAEWTNIVNYDRNYSKHTKQEAILLAISLTEQRLKQKYEAPE